MPVRFDAILTDLPMTGTGLTFALRTRLGQSAHLPGATDGQNNWRISAPAPIYFAADYHKELIRGTNIALNKLAGKLGSAA